MVVQRIFDRDGLALGIHRDRRDFPECIGDGLEIAFGVIAECHGVVEGIGDGGAVLLLYRINPP